MMKEDFNEWLERRKNDEIPLECEKDEMEGISRESNLLPLRPKTSRGLGEKSGQKDQSSFLKEEQSNSRFHTEAYVHNLDAENVEENHQDEVFHFWKNLNARDREDEGIDSAESGGARDTTSKEKNVLGQREILKDDDNQQDSVGSLRSSDEEFSPSRPKTSRGIRPENGRGDSPSAMGGKMSSTDEAVVGHEHGADDYVSGQPDLTKAKSLESGLGNKTKLSSEEIGLQGCGEVLTIFRKVDEIDHEDEERMEIGGSSREEECDPEKEEAMASAENEDLPSSEENEAITPKSSEESMEADGRTVTSEEECQYERQQHRQWQLAAIGEWSTLCQDYDEDDYLAECYLRMDEFQKEQVITKEWEGIVDRYHPVDVIKDLQGIQTLCKCTINQSERALRQFCRICHGPVPLSESGQTKAEALASLSRLVQQQTRHISEDVSNIFSESYQILEELDVIRERQDRVEEFLEKDFRRRDAGVGASRSSSRSSTTTPRWTPQVARWTQQVSKRTPQWLIDKNLADTYMKYRVRSTDLFPVMSTIQEHKVFHLEEIQEEAKSNSPSIASWSSTSLHQEEYDIV